MSLAKEKVAEPTKGRSKKTSSTPTAKTETKAPPNPLLAHINGYVRYYREGWRVGTLVEITKGCARIRPVGGKGSKDKDCIRVAFDDIRPLSTI